jgi:predicted transcriptional regulator
MGAGRPRVEIDRKQFESLCALQCTLDEIAGFYRCTQQTIRNWVKETYKDEKGKPMNFLSVYKKYSEDGKISLRRYQFQLAKKSATMAIWLGKQMLKQTDRMDDGEMTTLKKEKLRTDIESAKRTYGGAEYEDDGFTEAVKRSARGVWDDDSN